MSASNYHALPVTPEKDVVRVVSLSEDGVLLVQESDDPNWKLPGGKIHADETIFDAVVREVDEELGVALVEADIQKYVAARIPDSEHIRHIFRVRPVGVDEVKPTEEVTEARYFSLDALPETQFAGHILSAVELAR